MLDIINIEYKNEFRHLASNEGATYDFPMIIGSENTTEIYTLTYVGSEGNFKNFQNICLFFSL